MSLRPGLLASLAVSLLVLLTPGRPAVAADQEALAQQMTALNKSAIAAYSDGEFDKAKKLLMQAVNLSKKDSGLLTHPLMARTYLHLGVLYVDGYEDKKTAVTHFRKALEIRPDIELTEALATKSVKAAFEEAGSASGGAGAGPQASPAPPMRLPPRRTRLRARPPLGKKRRRGNRQPATKRPPRSRRSKRPEPWPRRKSRRRQRRIS